MIAMDKIDIAKYLRDYAVMSELIRSHPNIKIGTLYRNYMISNGRIEEYQNNSFWKMIRVYGFMTELRIFSFIEDMAINYLNEDDLDFDDIKSEIFIKPKDAKMFSKREIIEYIRKAFNHNDDDTHSKFNISFNGRYLEIDLLDARKEKLKKNDPQHKRPLHLRINGKQINKIRNETLEKSRNLIVGIIDFDKFDFSKPFDEKNIDCLEFVRIYFDKKVPFPIIKDLWESEIGKKETVKERIDLTVSILNKHNYNDYHILRYPLNISQKKQLKNLLKSTKSMNMEKIDKGVLSLGIKHLFNDVIPLGMFHYDQLCYEQEFASWFMDPNLSLNEIESIIENGLTGKPYVANKDMPEEYSKFDKERYEMLYHTSDKSVVDMLTKLMFLHDYKSRIQYPIALYLGYISDSLNNETEIEIEGVKYDASHIRNAFVHGRWFLGENDTIELYDCKNGKNNDYNFDWNKSINLHKLLEVMDNIYKSKQLNNKQKNK